MNPAKKVFNREPFALLLTVESPAIPERIISVANEFNLVDKSETHISIMVSTNARIAKKVVEQLENPEGAMDEIQKLFDSYNWVYALRKSYYLQEWTYTQENMINFGYIDLPNHIRRSIIQKVDLPDVEPFYQEMSDLLNVQLTLPVPHITLFAWSDYTPMMQRGIGVSSQEEFELYTKKEL